MKLRCLVAVLFLLLLTNCTSTSSSSPDAKSEGGSIDNTVENLDEEVDPKLANDELSTDEALADSTDEVAAPAKEEPESTQAAAEEVSEADLDEPMLNEPSESVQAPAVAAQEPAESELQLSEPEEPAVAEPEVAAVAEPEPAPVEEPPAPVAKSDRVVFTGRPISIEVRDANVRDVLNLISEQSGANLVVSDDVQGNVTIKLKQVPWDQALLLVTKAKQLGYVKEGNVLRIAPLEKIKKEAEDARAVIESQRLAQPMKVIVIPLSYAKADELATQAQSFLSARGKVVADKRTSSLIVTDISENIERINNLVKAIDIPPLQVMIEGKIVEATEALTRNMGISWSLSGQEQKMGKVRWTPSLNVDPGTVTGNGGTLKLNLGTLDLLGDLTSILKLAEEENNAKVISSPRILAMNNEKANISQSTNIPIPSTTVASGQSQTSYTFREIQMQLEVTPQVTSQSDIVLNVGVKREFASNVPQAGVPPNIDTRLANTKILVRNGQTAVIGGIYQSDSARTDTGIPFLKDIPVLGFLFKNQSKTLKKNELLLFLTPRIVNADTGLVREEVL